MKGAQLFEMLAVSRSFCEAGTRVSVLNALTLEIPQQQLVAICGPSGAGKSTILHILGLLDRGYAGKLRMLGQELSQLSDRASTRHRLERIGFVFQRHHLVEAMTVLENVAWPHWSLTAQRRQAYSRARQLLDDFGLLERAHHRPIKLSGGELQRVALARALINNPAVVLADEPTAQLDETNARHIIERLLALRDQGHSIVVVTHDPNLERAADLVIHMSYGRIVGAIDARQGGNDRHAT